MSPDFQLDFLASAMEYPTQRIKISLSTVWMRTARYPSIDIGLREGREDGSLLLTHDPVFGNLDLDICTFVSVY